MVPRSELGRWKPSADRAAPLATLLREDRDRLPRLLSIRRERMAASPFAFLRGSAAVMARDLAERPISGLFVQMVGDAHAANFGFFATPERDLVFDVNDFDETLRGPWEWDVERLATSLVLAAEASGAPRTTGLAAARRAARAYRRHLRRFARLPHLDTWYAHLDRRAAKATVGASARSVLRAGTEHARHRTGFHAFPKLARRSGGRTEIRARPPLFRRYTEARAREEVATILGRYARTLAPERRALLARYRLADVAEKVVGIGSVGTRCSVALLLGDDDVLDPVILQVKEALPAVAERYLPPSPFATPAERVVVGQRAVQEASDIFLGWAAERGRAYYVRQLRDMKFATDLGSLGPSDVAGLAELCGYALARAHARTGDAAAISGYVGSGNAFDRSLERFADRYARQVDDDYGAFRRALRSGRFASAPRERGSTRAFADSAWRGSRARAGAGTSST